MLARLLLLTLTATQALPDVFEWAGTFAMADGTHTWSMQSVGCGYADPAMKVVMFPTSDTSEAGIEAVEAKARTLFYGSCTTVSASPDVGSGSAVTMKPASTGSCFDLVVDEGSPNSFFTIDSSGMTGVVIFAQHVPTEFERDEHYLKDSKGTDIEPVAQEGGGDHGHDHGRRLSKRRLSKRLLQDAHAGHDHGGGSDEYEWAGVFPVADTSMKWSMEKVGGDYADPAMKIVIIPSPANPSEKDTLKEKGETLMKGTCKEVEAGESMKPDAAGSCFDLHVNCAAMMSEFTIDTTGLVGMTIFAQHVPTEFESTQHYLKDSKGEDIEPLAFEKRWGEAIGAALIVNLVTLVGVILMVPVIAKMFTENPNAFAALANAFAAGALISCAFFLMFPEGYLYVAVGSPSEGNTAFMFGLMVLLGVMIISLVDLISHVAMGGKAATPVTPKEGTVAEGAAPFGSRTRVLSAVLIGDFAHNFFDGTFIGIAFSGCSNSMAWGIAAATIFHEIAQELADFIVLTDPKQGNLSPAKALLLNFVSGLSVVLGVIIVMAADLSPRLVGCGLTLGGGIYIQIGLSECMGHVYAQANSTKLKVGAITLFCLGALAIGLVLLDHEHCVPEGDTSHEGHDHGRRLMMLPQLI